MEELLSLFHRGNLEAQSWLPVQDHRISQQAGPGVSMVLGLGATLSPPTTDTQNYLTGFHGSGAGENTRAGPHSKSPLPQLG